MHSQKHCYNQPHGVLIEPGPNSPAVGYINARSLQYSICLDLRRRRSAEFAESNGWELIKWYGESEKYEYTEQFPVFAQLLNDASSQFQVVLYSASRHWPRSVSMAFESLKFLHQFGAWRATADGQWDINSVWQEGLGTVCVLTCVRAVRRDRRKSRTGRKEGN
jgi:hypothetical protein